MSGDLEVLRRERRDMFAAAALQGLLAYGMDTSSLPAKEICERAVEYAEQMLEETK